MRERLWPTKWISRTRYRVGLDALSELRAHLEPLPARVPIIADPEVWRIYGDALRAALHPCKPLVLHVDGEGDKELNVVERLVFELVANRVHRREKLVLLGGGVCCDLGGVVALLYMRGMDYAIVATSLIAQVDAAIGGKVGCNAATRKNLLGGFHHAQLVLIDPSFLKTLPPRHFRAALAEALKLGLLLPELEIVPLLDEVNDGDPAALTLLIERCLDGKLSLLEADPFEEDLDRLLNLGHAVAHALEKVPGCSLLHGEAVAIGLAATARYAEHEGNCSPAYARGIVSQITSLGLPATSWVDTVELRARLAEIPDHRGGRIRLVVPTGDSGVGVLERCDLGLLADCVRGLPVTH